MWSVLVEMVNRKVMQSFFLFTIRVGSDWVLSAGFYIIQPVLHLLTLTPKMEAVCTLKIISIYIQDYTVYKPEDPQSA